MKRGFQVIVLVVMLFGGGLSFSTRPKFFMPRSALACPSTRLGSSTSPLENQSKAVTVDALRKLLNRQLEEADETMRLIKRLEGASGKLTEDSLDDADDEHISTAASILSGFDYGFRSRSEGPTLTDLKSASPGFEGYGPPANIWVLGSKQFMRNLRAMIAESENSKEEYEQLSSKQRELQEKLERLTLSSDAIWDREIADGPIEAPWVIKIPYLVLCYMLDRVFENKYVPHRFFLLETVARMPYFSYIGMLHFYETLGFWRRSADVKRIHFAEEINEFRHLLIMESLGGDQAYWVRFMAQHSAIAYFIGLCFLWALSPSLSYRFSELLESHAVNTYGQFLDENEELLKELPPPLAAVEYYSFGTSDPFYAEFQTAALAEGKEIRRPGESMLSLYDTFAAICADEGDHVSTMQACLDNQSVLRSPSLERRILYGAALIALGTAVFSSGSTDLLGDTTAFTDGVTFTEGTSAISSAMEVIAGAAAGAGSMASSFFEDAQSMEPQTADFVELGTLAAFLDKIPEALKELGQLIVQLVSRL